MSEHEPVIVEKNTVSHDVEATVATNITATIDTNGSAQQEAPATGGANVLASARTENGCNDAANAVPGDGSVEITQSEDLPIAIESKCTPPRQGALNGETDAQKPAPLQDDLNEAAHSKLDNETQEESQADGASMTIEVKDSSAQRPPIRGQTEPPEPISPQVSRGVISSANLDDKQAEMQGPESAAPGPQSVEAANGDGEAEWEIDSSPIQSSSSDTSSDASTSSDDSDDSSDDGYTMLDPAEQARILMEGDGGSDDEGGKQGDKGGGGGQLRTKNEKPDEIVEKPDIAVTPDMSIEGLGIVENLVENLILIKATTSGEYQVLETGSLLCLEDRSVIGVVAETLGRVQQPFYSVRFTNAAGIAEAGTDQGTKIFYVKQHSTYVFTEPLKAFKGSDASNLHDEEVGEDEMEFSDDEAEAEYKRRVKQDKRARKDARFGTNGGPASGPRNRGPRFDGSRQDVEMSYNDNHAINYDDNDIDEGYTPLARPPNLHEIMGRGTSPVEGRTLRAGSTNGWRGNRGGNDRGRGRGDRGRGRGGRGDRDRDQRNMRGSGSQAHNGDRRPSQREQQRYGYPPPSMSVPAPPSFSPKQSPQQPHSSSQMNQFSPTTLFQQNYPQQAFSPAQESPQTGYSMPPQNFYSHPPQYTQQLPFPQHHQHQQQQQQQQRYSHQQNHQPHPLPPNFNTQLPPGAFLNPSFFSGPQQQQQPQQPHDLSSTQNRWSVPSQQHQYPTANQNQWTSPARASGMYGPAPGPVPGSGQFPAPGHGHGQELGQADAVFRAAQEKIDILRNLGGGGGGGG